MVFCIYLLEKGKTMKIQKLSINKLNLRRGTKKLFSIKTFNIEFKKMQIIGANGCGKTTFLKYLKKNSNRYFDCSVGFVNQHPMLLKRLGIEDNCKLLLKGDYSKLLDEYFSIFPELDNSKTVSELSGGQTQILNILFNLHQKKEIYFIDEPYNNLDKKNRYHVEEKLRELNANLIVVAHGYQLEFCDKYVLVENKQLKEKNEAAHIPN